MSEQNITEKVDFNFIRYASCWEDAEVLLEALGNLSNKQVLSIASAGDNSFSLLVNDAAKITAVDVNEVQLHLCELKKTAIEELSHAEYLQFAGFEACDTRIATFDKLAIKMPCSAYHYWKQHLDQIQAGFVYQGKFEKYLRSFAIKILPLVHSKKTRTALVQTKSVEEQRLFYVNKWNTWRYRLLFKIFFSKAVMGKYGRDPEFLKEVKLKVSDYIFQKTEKHLSSKYVHNNHFVYYLMNGDFKNHLPHYARKENYEIIKQRIDRIEFKKGYIQDFASIEYQAYNLSNIFEYMSKEIYEDVAKAMLDKGLPGTLYAYWNLMVPRRISGSFPEICEYEKNLSTNLSEQDKCFFYNQFILDKRS